MNEELSKLLSEARTLRSQINAMEYDLDLKKQELDALEQGKLKSLLEEAGLSELKTADVKLMLKPFVVGSISYDNALYASEFLSRVTGQETEWSINMAGEHSLYDQVKSLYGDAVKGKPSMQWNTFGKTLMSALENGQVTEKDKEVLKINVGTKLVVKEL